MQTPRALYLEWEQRTWEAGALDFDGEDRAWKRLPAGARGELREALAALPTGDDRIMVALVPFVDAAPGEEAQVFLTTQLADVARHIVLFDRIGDEVTGERPRLDAGLAGFLLERLPAVVARVRSGDPSALIEGIRFFHLEIVERRGIAAARRAVEAAAHLPAVRVGITHLLADFERHARFGRAFLAQHGPR